jgi:hypothetical protein
MDAQPAPPSSDTTSERGLSADEVRQRVDSGRTNSAPQSASPPVRRILLRNLLSPINFVFAVAVVAVVSVGARFDALFALPLLLNIIIGITEELSAKRQLDRLTLLVTPNVTVRRDGHDVAVRVDEVVADALGSALVFPIVFAVRLLRALYDLVPLHPGQYALAVAVGGAGAGLLIALSMMLRARITTDLTSNVVAQRSGK